MYDRKWYKMAGNDSIKKRKDGETEVKCPKKESWVKRCKESSF